MPTASRCANASCGWAGTGRIAAAAAAARIEAPRLPPAQILGIGVRGEVALDHLKLVSLGLQCWSDDTADGARVLFADPDTLAVTVLERSWPRDGATAPTPVLQRRVAGQSLRQLAAAQVVTPCAKRRANGVVYIGSPARHTSVLPLSPTAWDGLAAPLRQPGGAALARHLRESVPDFVQPRQAIAHVHVLPVAEVGPWGWDAAAQTLRAQLRCGEAASERADDWIEVMLPHEPAAPGTIDAFGALLADGDDPPRLVAGPVRLHAGTVRMQPLAVLTARRAVVLQASAATAQTLPPWSGAGGSDGLVRALDALVEDLALWARQGLRHQPASAMARVAAHAESLERRGLVRTAALLREVSGGWRDSGEGFVAPLTALVLVLRGLLGGEAPA